MLTLYMNIKLVKYPCHSNNIYYEVIYHLVLLGYY